MTGPTRVREAPFACADLAAHAAATAQLARSLARSLALTLARAPSPIRAADEAPETTAAFLGLTAFSGDAGAAAGYKAIIDALPVLANETGNPSMQASAGLLYYSPAGTPADLAAMPLDALYPSHAIAHFRSAWAEPSAVFVGYKAGSNGDTVHAHQDAGSFIFHAAGERLIGDIGRDSYALPCYFCPASSQTFGRFSYYRLNALGHNTLTLGGAIHDFPRAGAFTSWNVSGSSGSSRGGNGGVPATPWVLSDLTPLLASQGAASVRRGVAMLAGRTQMLIRDELTLDAGAVNLTWAAHSNASVVVAASGALSARITRGAATAILSVLAAATDCPGLAIAAVPIDLAPPQLPSTGWVRTQIVSDAPATCRAITVLITLEGDVPAKPPAVAPLDAWPVSGPLAG